VRTDFGRLIAIRVSSGRRQHNWEFASYTLGRTIITSGTTLAAVLALYLFGGTVLKSFAFTLLVGIVAGTWSTVFVAAPVAALLARRSPRRGRSEEQEGR